MVAAALTMAVLPTYLILATGHPLPVARAGAVLGWLAGHALTAWSLRTQIRLPLRTNLAFPGWAASAIAVGLLITLTPIGDAIRLAPPPAAAVGVVAALIAAAIIFSAGARTALHLGARL